MMKTITFKHASRALEGVDGAGVDVATGDAARARAGFPAGAVSLSAVS
jgi:hypothetical protein